MLLTGENTSGSLNTVIKTNIKHIMQKKYNYLYRWGFDCIYIFMYIKLEKEERRDDS